MSFCRTRTLKQTLLASAVLLALSTQASHAATTLTFQDNANPLAAYISTGGTYLGVFETEFGPSMEYRMIGPTNTIGGGGEKDVIFGGETWTFDDSDATSLMTGVNGMPSNSGAANSPVAPTAGTNDALQQAAPFFGGGFTFLAPTNGSLAGNAYGSGKATILVLNTTSGSEKASLTVEFPVLEAQWGGTYFPLGQNASKGIKFSSNVSNIVLNSPSAGQMTFDFVLYAEHIIDPSEDPGAAGFANWTGQWELPGSGQAKMVFPESPTSSNGTLSATTSGTVANDGRIITVSELTGTVGATTDTGVTEMCVGSCWDFTITTVTVSSIQVTLPLSAPVPADPAPGYPVTYRKYMNGAWSDFDTSGNNNIESAPGTPGVCSAVVSGDWTAGLTAGNYCVRLTIVDDGPNDANKTTGTIVDPGGIGVPVVAPAATRVGSPLSAAKGCSMSPVPVDPSQHADWWLVAGFLAWMGMLVKRRKA